MDTQPKPRLFQSVTIGAAAAFFLGLLPFFSGICLHLCIGGYVTTRHYCLTNDINLELSKAFGIAFLGTGLGALLNLIYSMVSIWLMFGESAENVKEGLIDEIGKAFEGSAFFKEGIAQLQTYEPSVFVATLLVGGLFGAILSSAIGAALGGALGATHARRAKERRDHER
ncbi:MAG: hypothetical protein AAGB46_13155 [Verrucomicrobiota bacterium]